MPKIVYKEWKTILEHLELVTLHRDLQLVLSKAIRIGDTNIQYLV